MCPVCESMARSRRRNEMDYDTVVAYDIHVASLPFPRMNMFLVRGSMYLVSYEHLGGIFGGIEVVIST